MRSLFFILLALLPMQIFAQACIVETQSAQVKVKVCQQNRTIPEHLFRNGFCKPQLAGQKTAKLWRSLSAGYLLLWRRG